MGPADAASAARPTVSADLLPELRDALPHRPSAMGVPPASAAQRFHLDVPGWWQPPVTPPLLPALADAVWDDRRVTAGYRRGDGPEVERELDRCRLVLKAGAWYAVARCDGDFRVYRVYRVYQIYRAYRVYRADRFWSVVPGPERFRRDPDFDLAGFWAGRAAEFARSILRGTVVVRLTPAGARRRPHVTDAPPNARPWPRPVRRTTSAGSP